MIHEIHEEGKEILAIHTQQWHCRMRIGLDRHVEHNTIDIRACQELKLQPLFQQSSASPTELQPPACTIVQRSVRSLK